MILREDVLTLILPCNLLVEPELVHLKVSLGDVPHPLLISFDLILCDFHVLKQIAFLLSIIKQLSGQVFICLCWTHILRLGLAQEDVALVTEMHVHQVGCNVLLILL